MVSGNFQMSWTPPNHQNWSWWLIKFFGHQNRSSASPASRKLTRMLSVFRISWHYPLLWIAWIPQFLIRLEGWKKDQNWSWWLNKFLGHQNRSSAPPVSRKCNGILSVLRLSWHYPLLWTGQTFLTLSQKPAYGFPKSYSSPMPNKCRKRSESIQQTGCT